jgi:hypothetical protein
MMYLRNSLVAAAIASALSGPIISVSPAQTVGTPANPHKRKQDRSKYMPHQGEREIARRLRQQEKKS